MPLSATVSVVTAVEVKPVTCPLLSSVMSCIYVRPLLSAEEAAEIFGWADAIVKLGYVPVTVILAPLLNATVWSYLLVLPSVIVSVVTVTFSNLPSELSYLKNWFDDGLLTWTSDKSLNCAAAEAPPKAIADILLCIHLLKI